MNKLITISITMLVGACSTHPAKLTNAAIPASFAYREPVAPKLVVATPPQTSPKIKVTPLFENKETFSASEAFNIPETLSAKDEENLFPGLVRYLKTGVASWYGPGFHGKKTATGEIFDMYEMTAAHKTLPIPSYAEVTNLVNHKTVIVRINDRGPYANNRLLDLSYAAAKKLGIHGGGTGKVEIKAISPLRALSHIQKNAENQHKKIFMQIGSFGSQKKALMLHQKLAAGHLHESKVVTATNKRNTVYKVQLGPINSQQKANQLSYQLAQLGIKDPQFVAEARPN